jgi:hypothetical protein
VVLCRVNTLKCPMGSYSQISVPPNALQIVFVLDVFIEVGEGPIFQTFQDFFYSFHFEDFEVPYLSHKVSRSSGMYKIVGPSPT